MESDVSFQRLQEPNIVFCPKTDLAGPRPPLLIFKDLI
jgi:hypothetical protein